MSDSQARRAAVMAKYGDRIRALVDAAPPLTPEQRARLAAIIAGSRAEAQRQVLSPRRKARKAK